MDKLEPIIRHRFWILLGLSAPLIIYGYYSANGAIKEATQQREDALNTIISGVPSGELANETYAEGLKKINEEYNLEVALAHKAVLDRQSAGMDWPPILAEYVPDEYRGQFVQDAGYIYKDEYEGLLEDVYEIAEPVTRDGNKVSGKVALQYEILPRHTFGDLSVDSEKMWDAQEDIWFTRLLLEAVRTMNASAENIAKAPVRMVTRLELMGGDGQTGAAATQPGMGFATGEAGFDMEMMEDMYEEFGMDDEMGDEFGGRGFGGGASSIAFDPEDEFGSNVQSIAATPAAGDATGAAPAMQGMQFASRTRQEVRYVALDESKPYRERGFYLSVLIDQQQIARFLITLSNAEWPIRIVRFHVGPNPNAGGGAATGMYNNLAFGGGRGGMAGGGYDDYMTDVEFDEGDFGYDSEEFGDEYGGIGPGAGYGPPRQFTSDDALAGAFTHHDLVQLDVLGAITLFNPLPEDILAMVTAALQDEPVDSDSQSAEGTLPESATDESPEVTPATPDDGLNQPSSPGVESDAESEVDNEPPADPPGVPAAT